MSNKKAKRGRQAIAYVGPTKITKETPGVSIEVTQEYEDLEVSGQFASGDAAADKEMIAKIIRRHNSGDIWAWFYAKVTVSFDGLTSDQYLGACSYEDEADFRRDGGYFSDMVSEAIDELNAQIAKRDHFAACSHCQAVKAGKLPNPVSAY